MLNYQQTQNYQRNMFKTVKRLEYPALLPIIFGVSGGVIGWLVVTFVHITPLLLVETGIAGLLIVLILIRKLYVLILLTAVSLINTSFIPVLYNLSEFSLRPHDLILGIMGVTLLTGAGMTGKLRIPRALKHIFVPVVVFVSYAGLTLLNIYASFPEYLPACAASL